MTPSFMGTLKSQRTSTFLPCKSLRSLTDILFIVNCSFDNIFYHIIIVETEKIVNRNIDGKIFRAFFICFCKMYDKIVKFCGAPSKSTAVSCFFAITVLY